MKRTASAPLSSWTRWGWLFGVLAPAGWLAAWSYLMINGNLTLFNHPLVEAWQQWWWQWQGNQQWRTYGYVLPVAWWWLWWARASADESVWRVWVRQMAHFRWLVLTLGLTILVLLLGHNALSYDIYNYLFNAKMVVVFGANPHVKTALDFAYDPWVRFMHNVHTPAPYAYGWTAWSLIPFVLAGAGKLGFLASYLMMRVWMVLGFAAWAGALWLATHQVWSDHHQARYVWLLSLFQPLVLIETVLVGHNDVWMMAPALLALVLLARTRVTPLAAGCSAVLLAASISTKYVTIVLAPIWLALLLQAWFERPLNRVWERLRVPVAWRFAALWPELATLAVFVPLLTARSQQFHPWYFIWVLTFWPLLRVKWLRFVVLALSVSSSFRYVPWLWNDLQYTPAVLWQQKLITWSGLLFGFGVWVWCKRVWQRVFRA